MKLIYTILSVLLLTLIYRLINFPQHSVLKHDTSYSHVLPLGQETNFHTYIEHDVVSLFCAFQSLHFSVLDRNCVNKEKIFKCHTSHTPM